MREILEFIKAYKKQISKKRFDKHIEKFRKKIDKINQQLEDLIVDETIIN